MAVRPNQSKPLETWEKDRQSELQSAKGYNTVFQSAGLPDVTLETKVIPTEGSFSAISEAKRTREDYNPKFGPEENMRTKFLQPEAFDSPAAFEQA